MRLSLLDNNFLMSESRHTPMHVGGVSLFRFPDGVNETEFLNELGNVLKSDKDLRPRFADHLSQGLLSKTGVLRSWVPDERLDLDYHVRHSALPKPGRYRELFSLASRLHSTLLDRTRPLWEMHLIEGLQDRQFATYLKVHHSVSDGIAAINLQQSMLSKTARGRVRFSPFSRRAWEKYQKSRQRNAGAIPPDSAEATSLIDRLAAQVHSTSSVVSALTRYAGVWVGADRRLNVPWHQVPDSILSKRISGSRRFVAQSWPFERVHNIGKALGGTLNDAVLAMCAGALRRYLLSINELPDKPVKAMVPVSLRVPGDFDSANAIGFIIADLGTNEPDAAKRVDSIKSSMLAGKDAYQGLSAAEASVLTQITYSPLLISNMLGVGANAPAFSLIISNVPGPRKKMYWNGAPLEGIYPASIVMNGQALNITFVSYNGNIDFGITACRQTLPHAQRIIDFLEESLVELESIAGV